MIIVWILIATTVTLIPAAVMHSSIILSLWPKRIMKKSIVIKLIMIVGRSVPMLTAVNNYYNNNKDPDKATHGATFLSSFLLGLVFSFVKFLETFILSLIIFIILQQRLPHLLCLNRWCAYSLCWWIVVKWFHIVIIIYILWLLLHKCFALAETHYYYIQSTYLYINKF